MSITEIIFLAFALGIDCLVVSFSQGLIFTHNRLKNSLALALTMGLSQGLMPCIGYVGADVIREYVEPFSKFIVFAIFTLLGLKFIVEAFQEEQNNEICCLDIKCLIGMGIATSIDALVAGASLNFTKTPLIIPAVVIGLASFLMSIVGFWSGNFFKKFPSKYLEILGALILIVLGLKALF